MKFLFVLPLFFAACMAEMLLNFDPEKGTFMYATGDEGKHTRDETRESDGSVTGMYSYIDPNGNLRQVRYRAGPKGFKPEGDISVDKKTSEEAAKINVMAPKAPKTPAVPETPKVVETPIVPKLLKCQTCCSTSTQRRVPSCTPLETRVNTHETRPGNPTAQ
ncbi:uncharacterized protein LOC143227875 [Tachypleus tridentatus]|uniref:uncharacterized protein LOC143227875 n=1 Tax=Tachypleus tridentatus TaxID=6853 RepID=UPI003FD6388B